MAASTSKIIATAWRLAVGQSWLAGSIIVRALFGLLISVAAVGHLAPADSARAFQLMMLQAIVGILMTGPGFVRGATAEQRGEVRQALIASSLLAAAISLALIAAEAIAPAEIRRFAPFDSTVTWWVLMTGAAAGALTPTVQGVLAAANKAKFAYAPIMLANLLCIAAIPFTVSSVHTLLLLWSAAQIGGFIATIPFLLLHLKASQGPVRAAPARSILREGFGVSGIGVINAANMLIVYAFREEWRIGADPHIVEIIFFLLRISDVFFQLSFYLFSLGKFGVMANLAIFERRGHATVFLVTGLAITFAAACTQIEAPRPIALLLLAIMIAHAAMDLIRFFSSWVTIDTLRDLGIGDYLAVSMAPYLISMLFVWGVIGVHQPAALYVFLAGAAGLQVAFGVAAFARRRAST